MGHPQVPKTVARPGAAGLFYPDFRLHTACLRQRPSLPPRTRPPHPNADTRQPRARGSLPAGRQGEMGPGGQWEPQALGVSALKPIGAGQGHLGRSRDPGLARTPATPERPARQTPPGPRRRARLSSVAAHSLSFLCSSSLPPPFLFRGHNSLRETLSNKRFNMPALWGRCYCGRWRNSLRMKRLGQDQNWEVSRRKLEAEPLAPTFTYILED